MTATYALDIAWEPCIQLPNLMGPFNSEHEAKQWAEINIGERATWQLRELTYPYLQRRGRCTTRYTGAMPGLAKNPDCCLGAGHVGDHVAATGYRWPNETPRRQP